MIYCQEPFTRFFAELESSYFSTKPLQTVNKIALIALAAHTTVPQSRNPTKLKHTIAMGSNHP